MTSRWGDSSSCSFIVSLLFFSWVIYPWFGFHCCFTSFVSSVEFRAFTSISGGLMLWVVGMPQIRDWFKRQRTKRRQRGEAVPYPESYRNVRRISCYLCFFMCTASLSSSRVNMLSVASMGAVSPYLSFMTDPRALNFMHLPVEYLGLAVSRVSSGRVSNVLPSCVFFCRCSKNDARSADNDCVQ